jgi:uncharacterized protein (DUF427 family)
MIRAIWNGKILAEADQTEVVEGNHYFATQHVKHEFLAPSDHHTTCGWKGVASYFHVVVDGRQNPNAAWYYPDPKPAAQNITGRIAFWKGVQIEG